MAEEATYLQLNALSTTIAEKLATLSSGDQDKFTLMLLRAAKNGFGKRWLFENLEEISEGGIETKILQDGTIYHRTRSKAGMRILVTVEEGVITVLNFWTQRNYAQWREEIKQRREEHDKKIREGTLEAQTRNLYNFDDSPDGKEEIKRLALSQGVDITLTSLQATR